MTLKLRIFEIIYLKNGAWYSHSYYWTLIGSRFIRLWSIKRKW